MIKLDKNNGFIATLLLAAPLALFSWGCNAEPGGDLDGGSGADALVMITPEPCNQLDDNNDGNVDEGCACTINDTQPCWPGDPSKRNVGVCKDGTQQCIGEVEFSQWTDCVGAVLPSEDIPGDGIDQDCDGGDGNNCEPTGPEVCNNDIDDDCDGDTDCRDSDCAESPFCNNGDCTPTGPEICDDGIDNDCDLLIDCEDIQDCATQPWACTCIKQCPPGEVRWCDDPTYCRWGFQECNPDGTWGACIETTNRPTGCEELPYYDPICCVTAGECCQALPGNESIGDCPPMQIICEEV